jgi:hypothetical protein
MRPVNVNRELIIDGYISFEASFRDGRLYAVSQTDRYTTLSRELSALLDEEKR